MNLPDTSTPKPRHRSSEIRVALLFAGVMLAIPLGAKLAARSGWTEPADFAERALMVVLAAFLVATGNTIPKRFAALACLNVDPARVQTFYRFAGWTWVLTGLALGFASLLLPHPAALTATLAIVPAGMALIAYRWLRLLAARRPAP